MQQDDGQGLVLGLAARRRWVVRKSCTNIRTYCEAPGLVSPLSLSHPSVSRELRSNSVSLLSCLSLHFLFRHGWVTASQTRVTWSDYQVMLYPTVSTISSSRVFENDSPANNTSSRVSFEQKSAGDKGPVYPRGLNRVRIEKKKGTQIKAAMNGLYGAKVSSQPFTLCSLSLRQSVCTNGPDSTGTD